MISSIISCRKDKLGTNSFFRLLTNTTHVYCVCIHNSVVRTKCYSMVSRNETKQKMRCLILMLFLLLPSSKWNLSSTCEDRTLWWLCSASLTFLQVAAVMFVPESRLLTKRNNEQWVCCCRMWLKEVSNSLFAEAAEWKSLSLFFSSSQLYSYSTNPQQRPQTHFIVQ